SSRVHAQRTARARGGGARPRGGWAAHRARRHGRQHGGRRGGGRGGGAARARAGGGPLRGPRVRLGSAGGGPGRGEGGVGASVTLDVGGKVDQRHGAPLRVTGLVRTLSDGRFVHKGPMARGLPGRLGTTVVLDVNDVKVILISYRWQTLDPEMIRFV